MNKNILLCIGIVIGLILGFISGLAVSDSYVSKSTLEDFSYRMFNKGYDQCRDSWINSLIGNKDSCYYETNENNTMVRYVCGELTNGWKAIE